MGSEWTFAISRVDSFLFSEYGHTFLSLLADEVHWKRCDRSQETVFDKYKICKCGKIKFNTYVVFDENCIEIIRLSFLPSGRPSL